MAQPRPLPTSASYGITVRVYARAVLGRRRAGWPPRSARPAAWSPPSTSPSRAPTASPSTSPARRSTASTPSEIVDALRDVAGVDRAPGLRPHLPAAPGRQDLGRVEGAAARPATTCRWPTRPGVGRVSLALAAHPEDVAKLTIKGNAVAVVTDGSAVLGLGNIGPGAALPVMEGKAALFKRFADIDAWPICLDTQDTDEIVAHRPGDLARLRRHQPRGHLGAALLRDRAPAARPSSTSRCSTTTSTAPRSWCSPR